MPEYSSSDLLGIAGLVVGLIGISVSVFLYFRSKNKKILEYRIDSTQLITESMTHIPNLKVIIGDQPVETLISTTIEFVNSGNQSIVASDFAIKEPLGISTTGHLHSYDVFTDNPNSLPSLQTVNDNNFSNAFVFLKEKQTFSITLLHDGNLTVLGELKTGKIREYRKRFTRLGSFITGILSGCFGALISLLLLSDSETYINDLPYIMSEMAFVANEVVMILLIPTLLAAIWFLIRKAKNKKD